MTKKKRQEYIALLKSGISDGRSATGLTPKTNASKRRKLAKAIADMLFEDIDGDGPIVRLACVTKENQATIRCAGFCHHAVVTHVEQLLKEHGI